MSAPRPIRSCELTTCKRPLVGKRPQARWCNPKCANRGWHERRRLAAQQARPRCMICSGPIAYGRPGTRLSSVTCGKRDCVSKRYRWFAERGSSNVRRAA